jgi:hypothetical protein
VGAPDAGVLTLDTSASAPRRSHIKPWMAEFAPRGETRRPAWASELMRGYW